MAESQLIEYKEAWRDEYLRWICGFANAQGGTLYIGRRDDGSICGVKDAKKLMEDIPNKVRDSLGLIVDVDLISENSLDFIKISVEENPYPVNYKGEYHYRSGSTKQLLQGSALTNFLLRKTGKNWDAVPVENVRIDELDKESFDIFYREALRSGRMSESDLKLSRHDLLDKLGLIEGNFLKRAAVLLFHRNPEKWITGSFVKIGFFETDSDLRYQDEIHGSLIIQADRVIDLLYTKYLIAEISYDNITRIEHYPFPKDAVKEALFNALIHQDFSAAIPIQISVYRDRLYISNDCVFPENWTSETLFQKHRSLPHNPDIANTFFRAGFIESWGRGVEIYRKENCDSIVAVGGGSAMDVAKCIKLYSNLPGNGENGSWLKAEISPNEIPFLAMPTTAGTGSEATRYAVIYYNDAKQSITSESFIPDTVLMDPSALKTLPIYQKKATMCDALCHAIESFWSVNSTCESKNYSKAAIEGVLSNMDGYLNNTEEGNAGMLVAAHKAGQAINITQTTAGHAMCYKITSLFRVAHGHAAILCDRVLFPWMIENTDKCIDARGKEYLKKTLDEIGFALGCSDAEGGAEKLAGIFEKLELTTPESTDEQFDILKNSVNPVRLKNHPIALDTETINSLYHRILNGETK